MASPRAKKTAAAKPAHTPATAPLLLIWGEDDYGVKQRARQVFTVWQKTAGEFDHEIIDATAENVEQVHRIIARLREALQTLPFFGGAKVIWLKDCNFLGDGRLSELRSVTEAVSDLAGELQRFPWDKVRLLISAGKVDRRRGFYKMAQAIGAQEAHAGLPAKPEEWVPLAERFVRDALQPHHQTIEPAALAELVAAVGPNLRSLAAETEKLSLHAGDRDTITHDDVTRVVSPTHQAEAFAVAEALGDRDLPRVLRTLDEELWQIRTDRARSAIGLVLGLISKVRVLLLVKELVRLRHLPEQSNYNQVAASLKRLPKDLLPAEKKYNPALMHPFPVFKALSQARRYSSAELRDAMERLLLCNLRLVSSSLDATLELQSALIEIVGRNAERPQRRAAPAASRDGHWSRPRRPHP